MAAREMDSGCNGLFVKLAVVAFFLAISSSASYGLSFLDTGFAHYAGSPNDEAILYSFLYGLVLSQITTLFLPEGRLHTLFSMRFLSVFIRSLIFIVPVWLLLAWGGSALMNWCFKHGSFFNFEGEKEWFQISLVLLSASITLLTWHFMHKKDGWSF